MVARWQWLLTQSTKRLWFRASLFSVLGVVTALMAMVLKDYVPITLSAKIGADAVDKILGIIASSMLAVTTFSLSTMVAAYSAASSSVTPRATTLLMEDSTTQNALATFIGSFLFSLVGIIALSTGAYGSQGRVVLFAVTLVVVMLIVWTLLRWIDHLSRLGRVGETIDRVEAAALKAIRDRAERPCLGGCAYPAERPAANAHVIGSRHIGYVQHIDMQALQGLAGLHGVQIYLEVVPGGFVHEGTDVARVVFEQLLPSDQAETLVKAILASLTIGLRRTFEHDPRFGVSVLSEIASRALSPAVNDPGTAIDVITRGVRVFAALGTPAAETQASPACTRVYLRCLQPGDYFDDFFSPIARDGAGLIEINLRLVKALASLRQMRPDRFKALCDQHIELICARAEVAMTLAHDKQRLRECVARLAA